MANCKVIIIDDLDDIWVNHILSQWKLDYHSRNPELESSYKFLDSYFLAVSDWSLFGDGQCYLYR